MTINARTHLYLRPEIDLIVCEQDYSIEDGVYTDEEEEVYSHARLMRNFTRQLGIDPVTARALRALEEARWAARSGPVSVRRKEVNSKP